MADKLKAEKAGASRLDVKALKRCVEDINKPKEKAGEYTGLSGQATKNACETYGFNRKALTFVSGLKKKEASEQLEVLGAIVSYAQGLGMFDQMDMFNDAAHAMQAVIENASKGGSAAAAPGAANVVNLAAGTSVN